MAEWTVFALINFPWDGTKDANEFMALKPIADAAKSNRAQVIEAALFIKTQIETVLCRFFVGTDQRLQHQFRSLILEKEFCTFSQKQLMLDRILKSTLIIIDAERDSLAKNIRKLMEERNVFAHGDFVVDAQIRQAVVRTSAGAMAVVDEQRVFVVIALATKIHTQLVALTEAIEKPITSDD